MSFTHHSKKQEDAKDVASVKTEYIAQCRKRLPDIQNRGRMSCGPKMRKPNVLAPRAAPILKTRTQKALREYELRKKMTTEDLVKPAAEEYPQYSSDDDAESSDDDEEPVQKKVKATGTKADQTN